MIRLWESRKRQEIRLTGTVHVQLETMVVGDRVRRDVGRSSSGFPRTSWGRTSRIANRDAPARLGARANACLDEATETEVDGEILCMGACGR